MNTRNLKCFQQGRGKSTRIIT